MTSGVASFDGSSLAIPEDPYLAAPDTDAPTAPGQTGPYVVTGIQWLDDLTRTTPAATNAFKVNLTGASAVDLDLLRMALDPSETIVGTLSTSHELSLGLDADWTSSPTVTIDGRPVPVQLQDGVAEVDVPSGAHDLMITPGAEPPAEESTAVSFADASDRTGQYSDSAALSARLTDSAGRPLAGEQLDFTLGSSSAGATTDANGVAAVTVPLTDAPGEQDAVVSYGGRTGAFTPAIASSPFTITRDDSATALTVGGKGSKRTLTATLTDADSSAGLAGMTVVFSANGSQIGMATTNNGGMATISVPAGYRGEGITFRATFEGNAFYKASSDSKNA
jgi:hypothetical protein